MCLICMKMNLREKSFSRERFCTKTSFEAEAKDNSEMSYLKGLFYKVHIRLSLQFQGIWFNYP